MFPLKLVRSLVSGDEVSNNPLFAAIHRDNVEQESDGDDDPTTATNRVPLMLFLPNQELVSDTCRLAAIARFIGMDLRPNPSLSHLIFSWPPSSSSSSSSPWSNSLRNDTVPLPFPSFTTACLSHLRLFVALSKGYFKLAFLKSDCVPLPKTESLSNNNWRRSSLSLFAVPAAQRIESMDGFSRALLGRGWTLFKGDSVEREMYLYRKMDSKGDLRGCGRVRELRVPELDFGNVPLRILQYILVMTDDIFYLA